jgi:catechol 2,3-dioxygenase-like lactoylglutathione lyase family enzyme
MEPRLNVVTLAVDDLERALAFYRDGLGLQPSGDVATDLVDTETGAAGAIVIFSLESGRRSGRGRACAAPA